MYAICFIVVNAAPYGNERMLSALRLALAMTSRVTDAAPLKIRLFMMSDAVTVALPGQNSSALGSSLAVMLKDVPDAGVKVSLCRSCVEARCLSDAMRQTKC